MKSERGVTSASVQVSGTDAERVAGELRQAVVAAARPGEVVSPVEVERSPELVIAVIGLVLSGVSTAKAVWDFWHARRQSGTTVTILLADGSALDVAGLDREQLIAEVEQRSGEDR